MLQGLILVKHRRLACQALLKAEIISIEEGNQLIFGLLPAQISGLRNPHTSGGY
jgi:hypothetical protein